MIKSNLTPSPSPLRSFVAWRGEVLWLHPKGTSLRTSLSERRGNEGGEIMADVAITIGAFAISVSDFSIFFNDASEEASIMVGLI